MFFKKATYFRYRMNSFTVVLYSICVKFLPDYCWYIFLYIADIMVPVQEKVWSSLSDRLLVYYHNHLFMFFGGGGGCLFCAQFAWLWFCMIIESIFSALFLWCCVLCLSIAVLFESLKDYKKPVQYLEKLPVDLFLISSHHPQLLSAVLAVKCKVLFLSRY